MVQTITPDLWVDTVSNAAVEFYVSIFDDAALWRTTNNDEPSAKLFGQPVGSTSPTTGSGISGLANERSSC